MLDSISLEHASHVQFLTAHTPHVFYLQMIKDFLNKLVLIVKLRELILRILIYVHIHFLG